MKKPININQFMDIMTPEVAYFLGYLWADGYICLREGKTYRITMTIANADYLQVKDVFDRIGQWNTILLPVRRNGRKTVCREVRAHSPVLACWLAQHDFVKKTFASPSKILAKIPKGLRHYFWRGYLDGDGSLSLQGSGYRVTFAGHHDVDWSSLTDLLDNLGIKWRNMKRVTRRSRSSAIMFHNRRHFAIFCRYVYAGMERNKIGLQRKYRIWLKARENIELFERVESLRIKGPSEYGEMNILKIIRRYSGLVSRRKLVEFFDVKYNKLKFFLKKLTKLGLIRAEGHAGSRRFYAIGPNQDEEIGTVV